MTNYIHRCMIVPISHVELARVLCETLADGDAGKGMFTVGLSGSGQEPATAYISSGHIEDVLASLLPLTSVDAEGMLTVAPGQPGPIVGHANGVVNIEQVNDLLASIDVSEQSPYEAMDRLGLQLVRSVM